MSDETCQCCHGGHCELHDGKVKVPDNWSEILDRAVEVSARAQKAAHDEQDIEFKALIREKQRSLRCIGCGKEIEYSQWGKDAADGHFYGGGLICDRMGYGSTKHDMSLVAVLVCDDCVIEKGIASDWMDKLHKHSETERLK